MAVNTNLEGANSNYCVHKTVLICEPNSSNPCIIIWTLSFAGKLNLLLSSFFICFIEDFNLFQKLLTAYIECHTNEAFDYLNFVKSFGRFLCFESHTKKKERSHRHVRLRHHLSKVISRGIYTFSIFKTPNNFDIDYTNDTDSVSLCIYAKKIIRIRRKYKICDVVHIILPAGILIGQSLWRCIYLSAKAKCKLIPRQALNDVLYFKCKRIKWRIYNKFM